MNATSLRMGVLPSGMMVVLTSAVLSVMLPDTAVAQQPPQEWDGLVRVEKKALDHVYVRPKVEFKAYTRVRLDPVHVAMDKNWDPNSGRVGLESRLSSADVQRIREELSKLFRDVFAERLSKSGYPLVDAGGDDVLLVKAALINVSVNAPDSGSTTTRSFVMDAGRMTLVMELADSVTGQMLARVVDTKEGSDTRGVQWANSVTNSVEARRAIAQWADALCRALDTIHGKTAGK
jgi:hypothetical protein